MFTYADVVQHALDYLGSATDAQSERFARRAVQCAISDFWSKRTWSIFYRKGRIQTNAPYITGTVAYLASSGIIPRQVTLTGGTWPAYAGDCDLILNPTGSSVRYPISGRISDTVVQLQSALAPTVDIASTAYTLCQQDYPLPVDFGTCDQVINVGRSGMMAYMDPGRFVMTQRIIIGPALPWMYTIQGDSRRYGTLVMSFYPSPDQLYQMDFSYRRQSRGLNTHGATPVVAYTDGTASITSASTTITGTKTLWTPDMVGAVIRFGSSATSSIPTGQSGANPFYLQRTVTGWTSATSITMDQIPGVNLTGVPHSISDPVDLEAGAMTTYFLREVENQCRTLRRMESNKDEERKYKEALRDAMEADTRHHEMRTVGGAGGISRYPIKDMSSTGYTS